MMKWRRSGRNYRPRRNQYYFTVCLKLQLVILHYKKNTIQRRIIRRMILHRTICQEPLNFKKHWSPGGWAALPGHANKMSLTFRDPEYCHVWRKIALPNIIKEKTAAEPLHLGSGFVLTRETLFFNNTILEVLVKIPLMPTYNYFATDLSRAAINKARGRCIWLRSGRCFTRGLLTFTKGMDGSYRVSHTPIMCFAPHVILLFAYRSCMVAVTCLFAWVWCRKSNIEFSLFAR